MCGCLHRNFLPCARSKGNLSDGSATSEAGCRLQPIPSMHASTFSYPGASPSAPSSRSPGCTHEPVSPAVVQRVRQEVRAPRSPGASQAKNDTIIVFLGATTRTNGPLSMEKSWLSQAGERVQLLVVFGSLLIPRIPKSPTIQALPIGSSQSLVRAPLAQFVPALKPKIY